MDRDTVNRTFKTWIRALTGGHYHQGTGALKKGGEFCCLGVLCDLSDNGELPEVEVSANYEGSGQYCATRYRKESPHYEKEKLACSGSTLPLEFAEQFNISTNGELSDEGLKRMRAIVFGNLADKRFEAQRIYFRDRDLGYLKERPSLTILNDKGFTFKEIAEVIGEDGSGLLTISPREEEESEAESEAEALGE